jgi:hypothetical protein
MVEMLKPRWSGRVCKGVSKPLFPPGITELEGSIDFEEKMDFWLKRDFFDGARSKSESNQWLLSQKVSKAKWITDVFNCVSQEGVWQSQTKGAWSKTTSFGKPETSPLLQSCRGQKGKELNDFQRNPLDKEILSNLRFGSLEIRDISVTRVTNNNWNTKRELK